MYCFPQNEGSPVFGRRAFMSFQPLLAAPLCLAAWNCSVLSIICLGSWMLSFIFLSLPAFRKGDLPSWSYIRVCIYTADINNIWSNGILDIRHKFEGTHAAAPRACVLFKRQLVLKQSSKPGSHQERDQLLKELTDVPRLIDRYCSHPFCPHLPSF